MTFVVKENVGWHDSTILGPDQNPWFKVRRTNIFDFNAVFVLMTMSNCPLMILQKEFLQIIGRAYSLIRVGQAGPEPWCSIERVNMLGGLKYNINKLSPLCPTMEISGAWGTGRNVFSENNTVVASVDRQNSFLANESKFV
eukprot:CAMPEP_0117012544 /NCGR_PEP_ID=MMETSP0472-20121206/10534_1 /TAXON_ID=693140 ORGANISM="Tiarina fusus, Strain LIS" /NCGR_SAMPLE_ID=MMETSP0472 /ASSEMBLY_ACC=CAM_ASM_000603 /LENGTH=140 /DNA_ID=CAMNT_0004715639 /DNA_START=471 /DNA_END=890 /DNA_ORIENTATION=+